MQQRRGGSAIVHDMDDVLDRPTSHPTAPRGDLAVFNWGLADDGAVPIETAPHDEVVAAVVVEELTPLVPPTLEEVDAEAERERRRAERAAARGDKPRVSQPVEMPMYAAGGIVAPLPRQRDEYGFDWGAPERERGQWQWKDLALGAILVLAVVQQLVAFWIIDLLFAPALIVGVYTTVMYLDRLDTELNLRGQARELLLDIGLLREDV